MMRTHNPTVSVSERAQACDALDQLRNGGSLFVGVESSRLALPETLNRNVESLLAALVAGETALVSSSNEELTTQQVAGFLKLSRPTVVKMMDEGRIPFRKPGKHRRVRTADLLAFQEVLNRDRDAAIDELSALGQAALLKAKEESDR